MCKIVDFSGHWVPSTEIIFILEKVQAVLDYYEQVPLKKPERFDGLVNFHRRFVPRSLKLTQPLTDFIKGKARQLVFNDSVRDAFVKPKRTIDSAAPLSQLGSSASDTALGAVSPQRLVNTW